MSVRRLGAAATIAFVALFAGAAGAAEAPLLALVGAPSPGMSLARVDARRLTPLPRARIPLGLSAGGWSFSPEGSKLAIGSWKALGLRIVDTRTLRVLRDVQTRNGSIAFAGWLTPRRIVGWEQLGSFAVDPVSGKLGGSERVDGTVVDAGAARDSVIVLLATAAGTRPCRLAVVGLSARVRDVDLDRVRCSALFISERVVRWLGDGRLAVAGTDYGETYVDARGVVAQPTTPAGVRVFDTSNWTSRLLDPRATSFADIFR